MPKGNELPIFKIRDGDMFTIKKECLVAFYLFGQALPLMFWTALSRVKLGSFGQPRTKGERLSLRL